MTEAPPGKRLGTPPLITKWLNHDVDVIQKHQQRPQTSQSIERQHTILMFCHRHPFLYCNNKEGDALRHRPRKTKMGRFAPGNASQLAIGNALLRILYHNVVGAAFDDGGGADQR